MSGGDGNDIYYIDNVGDVVIESEGDLSIGGNDTVRTNLDAYTLPANVEILELLPGMVSGTGNSLDNTLFGSHEGNVLDGLAGNDTLPATTRCSAATATTSSPTSSATTGSTAAQAPTP